MKLYLLLYCSVTLLMLHITPKCYSREFCVVELIMFLITYLLYLKDICKQKGLLNFDSIFLTSFLFINYIHSVFIFPNDKFIAAFSFPYNDRFLCPGVALASVGISVYMLANQCIRSRYNSLANPRFSSSNFLIKESSKIGLIFSIGLTIYVFFILKVGYGLKHLYPRLMVLIVVTITLPIIYKAFRLRSNNNCSPIKPSIKLFGRENKIPLLSASLFTLSQLRLGSRTSVLFLMIIIVLVFNLRYHKLRSKLFLTAGIASFILMSIIGMTRVTSINLTNSSPIQVIKSGVELIKESPNAIWLLTTDLVVNARTLYESCDYVDNNDLCYGKSYIQYLFSAIPGGGEQITKILTGATPNELNSGTLLTQYAKAPYGIGTNIIADLNINFGLIGVIIGMMLLGIIVGYSYNLKNKYTVFLYITLVANAIYLPRAVFISWIDMWVVFIIVDYIYHFIIKNTNHQHSNLKYNQSF